MVTKRTAVLAHLDPDRAKLLKQLADDLRLPRSLLIRTAIDNLLMEHGKLPKRSKRIP